MLAGGSRKRMKPSATVARRSIKKRKSVAKRVCSKTSLAASLLAKSPSQQTAKASGIYKWEEMLWSKGYKAVAGTDEAGRGPLAGPVVAAAFVVLRKDDAELLELLRSITDSKKMTAAHREAAFKRLTSQEFNGRAAWAIAESSAARIDKVNILQASLEAMTKAVKQLKVRPEGVLVDGCNRPPGLLHAGESWTRANGTQPAQLASKPKDLQRLLGGASSQRSGASARGSSVKWIPRRCVAVIGGDAKVVSIAAASVLAKVHRDRIMARLDKKCPMYGFSVHKGYPTASHRAAIAKHGVSQHHRRTFGPVARILERRSKPRGSNKRR